MNDELAVPLGTQHPKPCGVCGDYLILTMGEWGAYYRCINHPDCPGSAVARLDGTPGSNPGTVAVKEQRTYAHQIFRVICDVAEIRPDQLKTRLRRKVGTSHFGFMNERQLRQAVREMQRQMKGG